MTDFTAVLIGTCSFMISLKSFQTTIRRFTTHVLYFRLNNDGMFVCTVAVFFLGLTSYAVSG